MKPRLRPWLLALTLVALISAPPALPAQLAITEVMSATRTNPDTGFRGAEYWELTNFGTNALNLDGYGFRDSDENRSPTKEPFTNLVIRAGESIIFFRVVGAESSVTSLEQFRAWWGESNLPSDLQVRLWRSPGLSGWDGDEVWLFDRNDQVVDWVRFGRARLGLSFTYHPETGEFGRLSLPGEDGAVAAELAGDAGSPGTTTGPVPARFLQQPISQSVDAGMSVALEVVLAGLPRPHCQWYVGGVPIAENTSPTLFFPNIQPVDAGAYQVEITNGLSAVLSSVAVLNVNTNRRPPLVSSVPVDATVFSRQTARFSVDVRGLPPPVLQWHSNGIALSGAVGPVLEIANVTAALNGTFYSVSARNELGTTNVGARLRVLRRPDLRFTEIMALPADEKQNRHFDWFELTNYDTNAVNLQGWRIADEPSFAQAFTITNDLTLQPGESAVFVERLDGRLFSNWWGADNLPPGIKVCTYSGFGLAALGETLNLWNPAATDPYDALVTVGWAAATAGISFECEHPCNPGDDGCAEEGRIESVSGVRGAFRATDGGDLGSPGVVANPAVRFLSAAQTPENYLRLRSRVTPGRAYRLARTASLTSPQWNVVQLQSATNNVLTWFDALPEPGSDRYYRLEEIP